MGREDFDADVSLLVFNGFNLEQIYFGISNKIGGDVYFVDGLEGRCFERFT